MCKQTRVKMCEDVWYLLQWNMPVGGVICAGEGVYGGEADHRVGVLDTGDWGLAVGVGSVGCHIDLEFTGYLYVWTFFKRGGGGHYGLF